MSGGTVSAEEARGLLAAFGDNRLVRLIGETDDETVIEVRGDAGKWGITESIPDNLAGLLVAAPVITREFIALHEEVGRLARILAVERGDESKAPDGWHNSGDQWDRDYSATDYQRIGREWCSITDRVLWRGYRVGTFPTALGAMEAADEARKESTTGGDDSPEGQP